jgi:hypothetical protein
MSETSKLPPPERAKRYRERAAEAERMAASREDELSMHYREIGELWRHLADELEEAHNKPAGKSGPATPRGSGPSRR